MDNKRDGFTSRFGIIAAAAGSAIGLGNIWRFPYVVGENGGAAFLLVYLFFIIIIGIPVLTSELAIGRAARTNAFRAFSKLSPVKGFGVVGVISVAAAFFILSFYAVVAGWTIDYVWLSLSNQLVHMDSVALNNEYNMLTNSKLYTSISMVLFLVVTLLVVRLGVRKGIERMSKWLMPLLFVIIIVLCIRSVTLEGASAGLNFLFKPDFSKLTSSAVLEALGQAFFSLSIGMGILLTYGSYIDNKENLLKTAVSVSVADTLVALLAGIAIFPAVFAFNVEPDAGPGLVFVTLPNVFNSMAGGYFFSLSFFLLLFIAALTSSVSLLEVIVAYFSEELKIERKRASIYAALIIAIGGAICIYSSDYMDFTDYLSSNILLPLGGIIIVIFVGWVMNKKIVNKQLSSNGKISSIVKVVLFIIKFIAPFAIGLVLLNSLGLFN